VQPGLAEGVLQFLGPASEQPAWRISRPLVLMGRARICKVRLPGSEISKIHCSLVRTPQGIWVVDLFGRGGLRVNGEPVRCARLEYGDVLRVGGHRIRLRGEALATRVEGHLSLPRASGTGHGRTPGPQAEDPP